MILRANNPISFLIEFPSGHPDGNIVWNLYDPEGTILTTGLITPAADAASAVIVVPGQFNSLDIGSLNSYRDVSWTYAVSGMIVSDERRYVIEGRVPYGASIAGVRTKLGIDDPIDLPEDEVSMVTAYMNFVGDRDMSLISPASLRMRDAIEATAALALLPSLMVRLAKKEDSGTSSFTRSDVDWAALAAALSDIITAAELEIDPLFDPLVGFGAIFILAGPETDAFTGA